MKIIFRPSYAIIVDTSVPLLHRNRRI